MFNRFSAPKIGRVSAGLAAGAVTAAGLVIAGAPAAHADQVVLTPVDVNTDATRATGHNDFQTDGVRVWTESNTSTDKAAAYFDVHLALAEVGTPSLEWAGTGPEPGLQLTTDFDGDGDVDGILVGETVYGGNWWVGSVQDAAVFAEPNTPPTTGGGGGPLNGTLTEWQTAYPDAEVVQAGWSLGSGVKGDGTVYGLTVGGTEYLFSDEQADETKVLRPGDVNTQESGSTGHNDFRLTSGVRVWTEGNTSSDKAAGAFLVGQPFAEVGEPSMSWRANGSENTLRPGLQLFIDINGDGAFDGRLVGERSYANGDALYRENFGLTNWWLTNGSSADFKALAPSTSGGYGSAFNGTLAEWRAALPAEATVVAAGWSLGSGVKGDGVIESITVGLTTYTFTAAEAPNTAPVAEDLTASTVAGGSVSVPLEATDADGDELTYTVDGEPVAGVLEASFGPRFVGTKTFDYTVEDGRGGSDTGTVTVKVDRAPTSSTMTVKPDVITVKNKVKVFLAVETSGATNGVAFVVKDNGKRVGTGTLDRDGQVKFVVGKLPRGEHVLSVKVFKGDFTKPSSTEQTITVKRAPKK
ncbi:hypothetical protein DJ010_19785 [Nocardioides silvaticus]|uniref:Bacterial Ig-like domain-containing protein n=1 Tax=Nocardioides silvaticus TaxID=2201891 RepID=A0A316TMX8_9ACTN|nr:Ig-like domain-containing protein [Nocardioides silvaticus]PWN01096.1 hypothetical protein DJ010_19785 [Nocardioides silvaticus]